MRTNTQRATALVLMLTGILILINGAIGRMLDWFASADNSYTSFQNMVLSVAFFAVGFIADILISISEKLSLTTYNIRTENVNLIEDKPND